jgi:NAD-dependent deacetylase sirtuin 2
MCGAGISTAAGVPDFRSPSAGLYFKIRNIPDLPYPEAVFDGAFFRHNPKPFYSLIRSIFPQRLCPTDTHKFFALLNNHGILRRVYTQNIDALENLGGVPEEKIIEAHGTFRISICQSCRAEYDLAWLKAAIFSPEENDGVPKCPQCQTGVVRPQVVFFGEKLPVRY